LGSAAREPPPEFLDAVLLAVAGGLKNVQFFNDEAIVPALSTGASLWRRRVAMALSAASEPAVRRC